MNASTWWSFNNATPGVPFDRRFHLILNLAVGGDWAGRVIDGGSHSMLVDYVKVRWDDGSMPWRGCRMGIMTPSETQ